MKRKVKIRTPRKIRFKHGDNDAGCDIIDGEIYIGETFHWSRITKKEARKIADWLIRAAKWLDHQSEDGK